MPLAGGDQYAEIVFPLADTARLLGVDGGEQVPGNVSETAFDEPLLPDALTARIATV